MSTPLSQMPKPDASQYDGDRKLFLVPNFMMPATLPGEGQSLLENYWSDVRDSVGTLERKLGKVSRVYHELIYDPGDPGIEMLEHINPKGSSFIKTLCQSDGKLEALEDKSMLEENMDWQRCLSIGLVSEKVMTTAMDGFNKTSEGRSTHMIEKIDKSLGQNEAGVLFIRENHGLQFPQDIRVFYVAPRALDSLKRWIEDQTSTLRQPSSENTTQGDETTE